MDFKIETYRFGLGIPDHLGEGIIHHCHALLDRGGNLPTQLKRDFLGFIFNLGNSIHYNFGDKSLGTLSKRQYLLAYIPQGQCELKMEAGKHALFCVEITSLWLDKLKELFPAFLDFVQKTNGQRHPHLSEPYRATPQVLSEIEFTLNHDIHGMASDLLVGVKYMLISMECLKQIETPGAKEIEIEKIREAYEYLRKNIKFACTVNALADRVDISTKKLEKAFKRIYGQTVYKALTHERLNRSIVYLRDTNLAIHEIASLVGYKDPDVFAATFKRNFGYPPGEVRKKANDDPHNPGRIS